MESFETESCIQGFHIYKDIWSPLTGEQIKCTREDDNPRDRYAVAVVNSSTETVGHVPRCISAMCSSFLRRGGEICCTVTGSRRYSRDLPQGGLEVPCTLRFMGSSKELKKVKTYFKTAPFLSKGKSMKMQPSTSNEVNELTLDANQFSSPSYSGTETTPCDSDKPSEFSCEKEKALLLTCEKEKALLLSNNKDVDEDNVHQPSSSSNLDFTLMHDVEQHVKAEPTKIVLNNHIEERNNNLNQSAVWVTFDRCSLQVSDKVAIETGKKLTDKHINFAQRMIKNQFPAVGGLKSTLQQVKKVKGQRTANSIQIVHCKKREHWITVSTKWCKSNQVIVYDSVFKKLDAESRSTIMHMFGLKNSSDIVMVPMQQQSGGTDCGVFAIAVTTSLVFDEDPSEVTYQQASLRSHLVMCFASGKLTSFPSK